MQIDNGGQAVNNNVPKRSARETQNDDLLRRLRDL